MPVRPTGASMCLAVLCAPGVPALAGAQAFVSYTTDCTGLHATAIAGYPSHPYQTFEFIGSCWLIADNGAAKKIVHTFPAKAYAIWDGAKHELRETFDIMGGFELGGKVIGGRVKSTFTCLHQPVVSYTPLACNGSFHDNATGLAALSGAYAEHRPITHGRVSHAVALKLSAKSPPPAPNADVPPPPAPTPNVKLVVIPVPTEPPPPPPVTRGVPPQGAAGRTVEAPPPAFPTPGPQPLQRGAELALANGNVLAARSMDGALRWVLIDPRGRVLRVFPSGATATTDRQGKVTVSLGRQVTEVGVLRGGGR